LRVQDVDTKRHALAVLDGKGNKDRQTLLSPTLVEPLQQEIAPAIDLSAETTNRALGPRCPAHWGANTPMPNAEHTGHYFPIDDMVQTPSHWHYLSPPLTPVGNTQSSCAERSQGEGIQQKNELPYLPPFLRHSPSTKGYRHSHGARVAGA